MSFKVVRIDGKVVAFGPNDDNYEPSQEYTIEEEFPTIQPTPEQLKASIQSQIDSLEKTSMIPRITREFMLVSFAVQAASQGIDPMTNIAYSKLKALDDQIATLRSQL